jgi:iron complex outermembrane receptor protein
VNNRILGCAGVVALAHTIGTGAVFAQEAPRLARLAGVVVDAQGGRPLPAARARILERHLEEPAESDGSFVFELPPGRWTLQVEHLGFDRHTQSLQLRPGQTLSVRVELHVHAIQLNEIVVTGTITRRAGRDVLSPISVVSGAELDRSLDGTVAATLGREPGIAVTSIGPATARPVIRGLGGDRILMLEDGQRPGDMSSTSGDHAVAIEPITAQQIEVVRGPMSLLYGSSALGGVVNVVRGEIPGSLPEHAHGNLTVQGSTVSRGVTGAAWGSADLAGFAVRAEASGRTSDDLDTPRGRVQNTDARTFNLALGGSRLAPWGHAGASYRFYDNRYGIPGGFVGGHETGVDIEMRRHTARGEAELHRGEERFLATVRATGSFSDYQHRELERSGDIGTEFFQELVAGELVARHGPRRILAQGAFGVRAQYRDIETGGSLRTPSTYDHSIALFAVEELGTGAWRWQVGVRYDRAHYAPRDTTASIFVGGTRIPVRPRTFGSVSGSLGVLYAASDQLRLGASVARAYRTPDFNELYSNGPHLAANSFDVGDPSLRSEAGFGIDAFVRVTSGRVRGEVAAFRNQLNDYIFPSSRGRAETGTQGGRPRFQYTNEDAVLTGAEADVDWSLTDRLVLEATTSYVRARFTSERAPIPIITADDTTFVAASTYPPFIPPLNGSVGVRYERPRFFVGGGVRWAAQQDRLGDFEMRTAAYAVGNVTAGVRLAQGVRLHSLTLTIDNVTNTEYRDHLSRIKDLMPQPGIDVRLMYRLAF